MGFIPDILHFSNRSECDIFLAAKYYSEYVLYYQLCKVLIVSVKVLFG